MVARFRLLPLALLAFPAASTDPPSIVIRHDRPDSAYIALGARYADLLAHVEERAEGVVLAPKWVLTSAHVAEPIGPFDRPYVVIRGEHYEVEKIIIHPGWEGGWDDILSNHDLALLKLGRPVAMPRSIHLYRGDDERGMVVTIVGRGKTGTGATGQVGEKGTVVRGATNQVDGVSATALLMVFGDGQRHATELEGAAGAGDSGGPALLERNDTLYLVGVGSAGTMRPGYSAYGTIDIYTRVSAAVDWITHTMDADPPPTVDWKRPTRLDPRRPADFPDTPVGRLAADFFETYRASLAEPGYGRWSRFYERRGDIDLDRAAIEERAQRLYGALVEPLGRIEIHGYSTAGDHTIQVLVYAPEQDTWRAIGLGTSPGRSERMSRLYMKWEGPPEEALWER